MHGSSGGNLKVLSTPKKRAEWYFKILRFLTFGKLFKPRATYIVKSIEKYGDHT